MRRAMKTVRILAIFGVVLLPGFGFAQNAPAKAGSVQGRRTPLPPQIRPSAIVRQDLFDRNNPSNLRSDFPAPPAQAGQF